MSVPTLSREAVARIIYSRLDSSTAERIGIKVRWKTRTKDGTWYGDVVRGYRKSKVGPWTVLYSREEMDDGRVVEMRDRDGDIVVCRTTIPRKDVEYLCVSTDIPTTASQRQDDTAQNVLSQQEREPDVPNLAPAGDGHDELQAQDVAAAATEADDCSDGEDLEEDLDDDILALMGNVDEESSAVPLMTAFQKGQGGPVRPLALDLGRDIVDLLEKHAKGVHLPKMVEEALKPATRRGHRAWLQQLQDMPIAYRLLRLGDALASWFWKLRLERKWRWTSTTRNMAALQGALKLLPTYRCGTETISLGHDTIWAQAMDAARKLAQEEQPAQAQCASYEDIRKALGLEQSLPVRVILILAWIVCGRIGDILQLMCTDVIVRLNGENEAELTLTFRRGKTIQVRGAFTVHASIPVEWARTVIRWKEQRRTWLFPKEIGTAVILLALRRVDSKLECRSIRRGAIQTMAAAGVSEEIMMYFSGHTSVKTLRRYLNWGKEGRLRKDQMTAAATALFRNREASPLG